MSLAVSPPGESRSNPLRRPPSARPGRAFRCVLEALEGRAVPATITVTSLGDAGPGTLRDAIERANLDPEPDTVIFDPAVRGTIILLAALPELATAIAVEGPGAAELTVARSADLGTPKFRIFTVPAGAEASVSGLTVMNGDVRPGGSGGNVLNDGSLSLSRVAIRDGSAGYGGGISNWGSMTLVDSTVSGNVANSGGGIYNQGTMGVSRTTISGNTSPGPGTGGGFLNRAVMTVSDSTVSNNTASAGGGIINLSGTRPAMLALVRVTVSGNTRGGVYGYLRGHTTIACSTFDNQSGANLIIETGATFSSGGHNQFSDVPDVVLDPTDTVGTDPIPRPPGDPCPPAPQEPQPEDPQPEDPQPEDPGNPVTEEVVRASVESASRFGILSRSARLRVSFSGPLEPAGAGDAANYEVVPVDRRGRVLRWARPIPVASASYDPVTRGVTLTPGRPLRPFFAYRLTVSGAAPGGVKSLDGLGLGATGRGEPGTDYRTVLPRYSLFAGRLRAR